jgi:hypothetical protein
MKISSSPSTTPTFSPAARSPRSEETTASPDQLTLGEESKAPKKWTVLLWSASENNLYEYMQADIDEAERVGSTPQMNVLVETDHGSEWFGRVKRYELQPDDEKGINSPVKARLGKADMADPARLADFIQWGMKNYPAENYALIISDHGAGWQGACHDEGSDSWMTLPEIEAGLKQAREKTGRKLDVVGFDACLMASAEVAHQLRNETSYLVGSQEVEGGAGWQYNRVLSKDMLSSADRQLRTRLDFTPQEFAANVVNMAAANAGDLPTMTALDTAKVGAVTDAVKNFGTAIEESGLSAAQLRRAKNQTQSFYEFHDLSDFARNVGNLVAKDSPLAQSAQAVRDAVKGAVVAEQHSAKYPNANGLTVELNRQGNRAPAGAPGLTADANSRVDFGQYSDTAFDRDTNWSAAIDRING